MSTFEDIHRAEVIRYILGLERELLEAEQARVRLYSRRPHTAALEAIARDRSFRLEQLVRAIEGGLYDQLDAAEAEKAVVAAAIAVTDSGRSTEDFTSMLPRAVEPALALETLPAHQLRAGDILGLSGTGWCTIDRVDVENDDDGTTVAVLFTAPDGQIRTLRTMGSEIKPILRPKPSEAAKIESIDADQQWWNGETRTKDEDRDAEREYFDAAEAEDVARIRHEMDIEAGAECDPETCVYCGGAR